MKYIKLTPTWRGLLPALVEVALNGTTAEGRKAAWEELYRLADFADSHNAEKEKTAELISAAAEASELFGDDELERFAKEEIVETKKLEKCECAELAVVGIADRCTVCGEPLCAVGKCHACN